MSRRFSEMNQVRLGFAGLVACALVVGLSFNVGAIRAAMFGTDYEAVFAESGGLKKGDDVRVAGLTVGSVRSVGIEGTAVVVDFTVEDLELGDRSTAAIKSDNALGRKFVQIVPGGDGRTETIPLERTTAPYGVTEALGDLSATTAELDVDQLEKSLSSLSSMFAETPEELRDAVRGVGRLSESISSRDTELAQLFEKAESVTGVLADRNIELTRLMGDGALFFEEITARRQVIHDLLVNARAVARELDALVEDNEDTIGATLDELAGVIAVLDKNEENLEYAVQNLGGFIRSLGEAVGGGPFFYAYLQNLAPVDMAPVIADLLRNDGAATGGGGG